MNVYLPPGETHSFERVNGAHRAHRTGALQTSLTIAIAVKRKPMVVDGSRLASLVGVIVSDYSSENPVERVCLAYPGLS